MAYKFSRLIKGQKIFRHPRAPQNPLVSVVMPTYRLRGEMNRRAMDSVINQTFRDFEYILVDDGSLDGLFDLLMEYQQRDPRIVIVRHDVNSGLPAARQNEGFLLASGKFLAYMFEDDYWLPNALETLVTTAEAQNRECVVYAEAELIRHDRASTSPELLGNWEFDYAELKRGNRIAVCASLHHRAIMDVCGLHDPHILMRRLSDYDFWLRVGKVFPFVHCKQVLARVDAGTQYSLGASIHMDVLLSYRHMGTDRNAKLLPNNIADFDLEELPFITTNEDAYRIREHYIIPFWVQHPGLLSGNERKLKLTSRMHVNRVLVTKASYSTAVEVALGNFDQVLPDNVYSQVYFPEQALNIVDAANFDSVLYFKTLDTNSLIMQDKVRSLNKTNIYLMDDNLLKTGTGYMAEEFPYLRPETTQYKALELSLRSADLVMAYAPKTIEDVKAYNPRLARMNTNIREKYILGAEALSGGRKTGRRVKYGLFTGAVRRKELYAIWPQLQEFFSRHKDEVEFHVWGVDTAEFGPLECALYNRPFENSYEKYLAALSDEKFDFMLSPIFDDHDAKISKMPVKYLEGCVAGAVGIFSNSVVYQTVQDGVTGLKTDDAHWTDALERSWEMTEQERHKIFEAARSHILQVFTTESQVLDFLAAFEAADLHRKLHSVDAPDGKARIAYFFHESILGGATLHLLKHALIARSCGFEPVLCFPARRDMNNEMLQLLDQNQIEYAQLDYICYTWIQHLTPEGLDRSDQIRQWMKEKDIRMVHMVTLAGEVQQAAKLAAVPLVLTLHQHYTSPQEFQQSMGIVQNPYVNLIHSSSLRYAWKWGGVLGVPAFTIRAPIEDKYFEEYADRSLKEIPGLPTILVSGTLQPRKRQMEAIQAVSILKKRGMSVRLILLGYDTLLPDYAEACCKEISNGDLEDLVDVAGFAMDPKNYYDQADFLLCPSDSESMPQTILKSMASGLRVISTPVGGVKELITDGFSGIITNGYGPEDLADAIERAIKISPAHWRVMLENAHWTAEMSCKEEVVRYQLLKVYNVGCDEARKQGGQSDGQMSRAAQLYYQLQPAWRAGTDQPNARRLSLFGLTYKFRVPYDHWKGFNFTAGTYMQRFNGSVRVTIRLAQFPYRVLRAVDVAGDQIVDNGSCGVYFEPLDSIAGKEVLVTIQGKSSRLFPLMAVYELPRPAGKQLTRLSPLDGRGGQLLGSLIFVPPGPGQDTAG